MTNDDRVCIACGASPNDTGSGVEPAGLLATRPLCRDALRCHSRELNELLYGWRDKIRPHSGLREKLRAGKSDGADRGEDRVTMAVFAPMTPITVQASTAVPKDEIWIVSGDTKTVVKIR